jgi:hypothetical protein
MHLKDCGSLFDMRRRGLNIVRLPAMAEGLNLSLQPIRPVLNGDQVF